MAKAKVTKSTASKTTKSKPTKATKKSAKAKPVIKPTKASKAPAVKASKKEVDKFGNGLKSSAHRINVALSAKTPKTTKELAKAAKCPVARVSGHIASLTRNGFIKRVDDGYVLR